MITEYVYKLLEEEVKLKKHFVPVSEMRVPYKIIHAAVLDLWLSRPGLLIFRGIFRGKFAEKLADFAGFSREKKSKFAEKSADFMGCSREKVKIRRKIGRFRGILAEKSQMLKDFQEQVLRKIGQFHGKFLGETSPRNNQ